MKKFLVQIVSFVVCSLILIQGIIWFQNDYIRGNANFKIPNNVKSVVIGNSHAECSLNDSLIDNFQNLASSGESYFYSFTKLKNVLPQNKNIKTVYVEFNNLSVSLSNDRWIWEKKFMNHRVGDLFPLYTMQEQYLLIQKNFIEYMNSQSVGMRKNSERILNNDFDFSDVIGGYNYLNKFTVDSLIKASNPQSNSLNEEFKASVYGLKYLDKIVNLCKSMEVRVIFIRSPQHTFYTLRKNEELLQSIRNNRYKDIEFLDFNDFELPDEGYADFEHLNYKGAKVFSQWFQSEINIR